jgi:hypothetical protein
MQQPLALLNDLNEATQGALLRPQANDGLFANC